MMLLLFVLLLIFATSNGYKFNANNGTYQCENNMDCELNGICNITTSACQCKYGWKGPSCGTLKLGISPYPNRGAWPGNKSHETEMTYSWGFSVIKDTATDIYHAYVNQGCYNASNRTTPMVSGCFLLHLQSQNINNPEGPYYMPSTNNINNYFPPSTFNPTLYYDYINNRYILYFRVNELTPYPMCYGNSLQDDKDTNYNLTAHTMDIAISDSPNGPWNVTQLSIANLLPSLHISNPSGIVLSNGTWVLSYRMNNPNGEHIGIAVSKGDIYGPYYNIANLSIPCEGPFLWEDKSDNTFHIIMHVENAQAYSNWPGLHAFSKDLYHWNVSNSYNFFKMGAYSTNITWTDGTMTEFYRREQAQILFNETGMPWYFYTAVQQFWNSSHFGYSYSVVTRF